MHFFSFFNFKMRRSLIIFPDVNIRHIGTELNVIRVHSISEINVIQSGLMNNN